MITLYVHKMWSTLCFKNISYYYYFTAFSDTASKPIVTIPAESTMYIGDNVTLGCAFPDLGYPRIYMYRWIADTGIIIGESTSPDITLTPSKVNNNYRCYGASAFGESPYSDVRVIQVIGKDGINHAFFQFLHVNLFYILKYLSKTAGDAWQRVSHM